MQPESPGLLWDARSAALLIAQFVAGRTWQNYQDDAMLRSAVERQFEIIGEALNKLGRLDRATAVQIPDLPQIVAFRNVLIHGYAVIDDELVWEAATTRAVDLAAEIGRLLGEDERT
ncbi:HepT-like ribonuclease domain-containing protein [Actinopolymorpha sp. NPDC004070]|uniref:HepT-like ribonuclease domain-containing protein n=1 Tax=Actinopolymorpha sp. NPDC004070 TaxID=3154548 RepID=UPI0033BCBB69